MSDQVSLEYKAKMNAVADALDETFNGPMYRTADKKVGFVLLLFPIDDGKEMTNANYIANITNRPDIIKVMRAVADRLEQQESQKQ